MALRSRIRSNRADMASVRGADISENAWTFIESLWPTSDGRINDYGRSVLAYAALPGEPDLDPVIDRLLNAGAEVFLPVVTNLGAPLRFGRVHEPMAHLLPRGSWGIREPKPELGPEDLMTAEVNLDLVFVPALGFGTTGARLGNGGGFYDRTFGPRGVTPLGGTTPVTGASPVASVAPGTEAVELTQRPSPTVLGVCFTDELGLPGLSAKPWDLVVPSAITEAGVHTF